MQECSRCGERLVAAGAPCPRCGTEAGQPLSRVDDAPPVVASDPATPAPSSDVGGPPPDRWGVGPALWLLSAGFVCAMAGLFVLGARPAANEVAPPAATAPAPARPPRALATPTVPAVWQADREGRWTGGDRRSVAFQLEADREVPVWMGQARPVLVVRCLARATDVFVYTESAAQIEPQDENHAVRLRFDEEPELAERWPDSSDHDALFAPDGRAMARRLSRARRLRFAFTPQNARPVDVDFSLQGVDDAIAPVAKACRWTP